MKERKEQKKRNKRNETQTFHLPLLVGSLVRVARQQLLTDACDGRGVESRRFRPDVEHFANFFLWWERGVRDGKRSADWTEEGFDASLAGLRGGYGVAGSSSP